MTKRLFRLVHAQARAGAIRAVQDAPEGYICTIAEPSRTLEQNAKFHALCSDIARAKTQWAGKPRNAVQWKVLLVSGHAIATKEGRRWSPESRGNSSICASQQPQ